MNNKYFDSYFLDSKEALRSAKQKNRVSTANPNVDGLQVCYYDGKKIDNAPINCINVPIDKILKYFLKSRNRLPSKIDFHNSDYIFSEDQVIIIKKIYTLLEPLGKLKYEQMKLVKYKIKNLKQNFNDKKLRVFIPACRETTVMQYVSKNIAESFTRLGYDLLFDIQNDMEVCDDLYALKRLYKFNPHIIININHVNNDFLSDEVFNFI